MALPAHHPVRLALIGCGEVTLEKHAPALKRIPGVAVAAVCDLDLARARAVAAHFGDIPTHQEAAKIFAMNDVDAVGVLTNPGSHTALASGALRSGKHVLVEKPLTLSPAEALLLIEEARRAGVVAMTGFHMRFHRLVREARERIARGELGEIESIRVVWHSPRRDEGIAAWKMRRATGGGALVEIGVHHFDLIRFLIGAEFQWLHAMGRNGVRDDEAVVVSGKLANGVLVSGEFSERSPHEIEIVVSGRTGWLRVDCLKFDGLQYRAYFQAPGQPSVRLDSLASFVHHLPMGLLTMRRGGDYRISYQESWNHFVGCVRNGAMPLSDFEAGLRATEAVSAAIESLQTGSAQPVLRADHG